MVPKNLVQKCLYNWLGYGKLNSPIWIIGTEEGGSGERMQLEDALKLRSNFSLTMDFSYVWEDLYGLNLQHVKLGGIWKFVANFLLSSQNQEKSHEDRKKFIREKLGRKDANHFMGEFLPLPKRERDSIEDYAHIWPTVEEYHQEVEQKRLSIINENIKNNEKIKLIVSYERKLTELMIDYYKNEIIIFDQWVYPKKQKYCLYKIRFSQDRNLFLLSTPFFGQGRISYDGLDNAVHRIKKLKII